MRRWLSLALLASIAFALMLPLAAPASAADPGNEGRIVTFVNEQRAAAGLPALSVNATLVAVARAWTDQMLASGTLAHNSALGSQAPGPWAGLAENVGEGPSIDAVDQAFMSSPAHRANVLGDYDAVGVGVDWRADGTAFVTVDFVKWQPGAAPATFSSPPPATPSSSSSSMAPPSGSTATGYDVLGSDGGVFSYGQAPFYGSVPGLGVHARAVLMSITPSQHGYWVLGSDGGVFSFGDARFFGSVPGTGSVATGVDLKPTHDGGGYWVLASDGAVFAFGDAPNFGSLPAVGVHTQAVKLVATPTGHGYWIVGVDGGIFSFGDAHFFGSLPGLGVRNTSVSMATTPTGNGYWILGSDGGVFSFGDARFFGSVPGTGAAAHGVQLIPTADGRGYYVLADTGRVFPFGDAPGLGDPSQYRISALDLGIVTQ